MTLSEALSIAQHHAETSKKEMVESAFSCLKTARKVIADGNAEWAWRWARESLAYSVGVFHPDYKAVAEAGKPFIL